MSVAARNMRYISDGVFGLKGPADFNRDSGQGVKPSQLLHEDNKNNNNNISSCNNVMHKKSKVSQGKNKVSRCQCKHHQKQELFDKMDKQRERLKKQLREMGDTKHLAILNKHSM